jgi:hypothetical protein
MSGANRRPTRSATALLELVVDVFAADRGRNGSLVTALGDAWTANGYRIPGDGGRSPLDAGTG